MEELTYTTVKQHIGKKDGREYPEGTIADIEDSYKYLGIPQTNGTLELVTRKAAMAKYL